MQEQWSDGLNEDGCEKPVERCGENLMDEYKLKPGARIELKNPPFGLSTAGRALGAIAIAFLAATYLRCGKALRQSSQPR